MAVSTGSEVVAAFLTGDASQYIGNGIGHLIQCSAADIAQPGFDFAPEILDRIQVRTVRRRIPQIRSRTFDQRANPRFLMSGQIIPPF